MCECADICCISCSVVFVPGRHYHGDHRLHTGVVARHENKKVNIYRKSIIFSRCRLV